MAMSTRLLFGGAIVAPVKNSFMDASTVRQIPDNQEVFVDTTTQQSLIVELLEQVEAQGEEVPRLHFAQLASDNNALAVTVDTVRMLTPAATIPLLPPGSTSIYQLYGHQQVAKFNEAEKNAYNSVSIIMTVVRLGQVKTDVIITINIPTTLAQESSEQTSAPVTSSIDTQEVEAEILQLLSQLEVKDWTLFVQ
ncbi:hypothetical protein BDF14DRAFT_1835667 [Spinellus fusiger]|nr:hypothetical protein BDF14DRAFT_1835667 [Spinellus fusiger]